MAEWVVHRSFNEKNLNSQPSQNQPAACPASCLLYRFDCLFLVGKYITIMIKLMACHLTGYVKITNNMEISVGKCRKIHQVCGKQTGLCGKISTVDKIDNFNAFEMYRTTVKWKVCQSCQQFKVFNRMHIIFASLDISLILLGYYFLTSISLIAQFFYSILAHFMC